LIGGLRATGYAASAIAVVDPDETRLDLLRRDFGIDRAAAEPPVDMETEIVVFCVKPQVMSAAAATLPESFKRRPPLFISVAAGIREPDIRRWLGFEAAIVRAMPNTPALVGSGATALYANAHVEQTQREQAATVMGAVGTTVWLEQEAMLDAVTAVSGSGPAYSFLLVEMMSEAGEKLGLPRETAEELAIQTAFGAAKMLVQSEDSPQTLRRRVTSPGGTTQSAVSILEAGGVRELFMRAMAGAAERARELGEELGAH
jgi:pyrroline-5-carboxylate reductase